jgi:hypothetical protein
MSQTNTNQLTVFLDTIGRTIIGKVASESTDTLAVENPAVVHVQPNPQTNQLQLQILPLFFREFQADRNQATVWNYRKANITTCNDVTFAVQFISQYEQMFRVVEAAPPAPEPQVIKLFEDDEAEKK